MKLKSLLSITLVGALFTLTGATCRKDQGAGANVGPGLLQIGVSTIAGLHLVENPAALPEVKKGAAAICAVAQGNNLAPAVMALAIGDLDLKTPEGIIIMNGALGLYALAFNGLADTNAPAARPYSQALCNGLNQAAALSGVSGAASFGKAPATSSQWPQLKFP